MFSMYGNSYLQLIHNHFVMVLSHCLYHVKWSQPRKSCKKLVWLTDLPVAKVMDLFYYSWAKWAMLSLQYSSPLSELWHYQLNLSAWPVMSDLATSAIGFVPAFSFGSLDWHKLVSTTPTLLPQHLLHQSVTKITAPEKVLPASPAPLGGSDAALMELG